jgi:hypothetical protein
MALPGCTLGLGRVEVHEIVNLDPVAVDAAYLCPAAHALAEFAVGTGAAAFLVENVLMCRSPA